MTHPIYNYDQDTGEFLSIGQSDQNQLEPECPLIPAFATTIEPPKAAAREIAVFSGNAWIIQSDWRGVNLYSTDTGEPVTVTDFGPQPAHTTDKPKPSAFHDWIDNEWVLNKQSMARSLLPTIPQSVSMRQARLALLGAGKLAAVNAAVANLPGAEGEAARIEWEYSGEVHRDKALVKALAPLLSFNDAQLDALFVAAAAL